MMKALTLLLACITTASFASEKFHSFTTNDGQQFAAVPIFDCSDDDHYVFLLEDGHDITLAPSELCEQDQDYMHQREMCELFMSSTEFLVIPTRIVDRKQLIVEETDAFGMELADAFNNSQHTLCLSLCNLGDVPLENLTIEYQVRYAQCRPAENGLALKAVDTDDVDSGKVTVSHTISGVIPLRKLETGENKVYRTEEVTLQDPQNQTGISGMWVNIYLLSPDGETLERHAPLSFGNDSNSAF